jgi:alkaline phosphatase D
MTSRRALLAALGAAVASRPALTTAATTPFTLGVASGDPLPDAVALWTRLAPDPAADDGGLPARAVPVQWEVAADPGFVRIVAAGESRADPADAHSVHVDATGLAAGGTWWYRFHALGWTSPVGRTRTAPAAGAAVASARFAIAACANWEQGWFTPYRAIAADDVDAVLMLGDYLYDYAPAMDAPDLVRAHTPGLCRTLAEYRRRWSQYRTDPDLQAAHAAHPWLAIWDDHEVARDCWREGSPDVAPDAFAAVRAAAYRAWWEHMPTRLPPPDGPRLSIYRGADWGDLAALSLLDIRQYRDEQACGGGIGPRCAAALDPARTMLGAEQEAWLDARLRSSTARWNLVAQSVLMAELDIDPLGGEPSVSADSWDGYPAARARLLAPAAEGATRNLVVLAGDMHSAWATDLRADFRDPASPVVATEFVTTAVSARNQIGPALGLARLANPHLRFVDVRNGYTRLDLDTDRCVATFLAVDDIADPAAAVVVAGRWQTSDGAPGAVAAS